MTEEMAKTMKHLNFKQICMHFVDNHDLDKSKIKCFLAKLGGKRKKKGTLQPLTDLAFDYFYTFPKLHKKPFKL